jgi:hypothetical protein
MRRAACRGVPLEVHPPAHSWCSGRTYKPTAQTSSGGVATLQILDKAGMPGCSSSPRSHLGAAVGTCEGFHTCKKKSRADVVGICHRLWPIVQCTPCMACAQKHANACFQSTSWHKKKQTLGWQVECSLLNATSVIAAATPGVVEQAKRPFTGPAQVRVAAKADSDACKCRLSCLQGGPAGDMKAHLPHS